MLIFFNTLVTYWHVAVDSYVIANVSTHGYVYTIFSSIRLSVSLGLL